MNESTGRYMSQNIRIQKNYYYSSISRVLQIYSPTHNKLEGHMYIHLICQNIHKV